MSFCLPLSLPFAIDSRLREKYRVYCVVHVQPATTTMSFIQFESADKQIGGDRVRETNECVPGDRVKIEFYFYCFVFGSVCVCVCVGAGPNHVQKKKQKPNLTRDKIEIENRTAYTHTHKILIKY